MKLPRLASLYVMRHGQAEEGALMDPDRTLTTDGLDDLKVVADFCRLAKVRPAEVVCSPLRRSRDTADFMVDNISAPDGGSPSLLVSSDVSPNADPKKAAQTLRLACLDGGGQDVLVVSHQPLIDEMLATLLKLPYTSSVVQFKHGAIMRVDLDVQLDAKTKANRVRWFTTPKLMGRTMDV